MHTESTRALSKKSDQVLLQRNSKFGVARFVTAGLYSFSEVWT